MTHIGIDPSSKSIHVVGDKRHRESIILGKGKYEPTRTQRAYDWIQDLLEYQWPMPVDTPFKVFLEQPLVGAGGVHSTLVQAYISGAIQAAASDLDVELELVNVQTWKKTVIGKGNASKDEVKAFAITELGWEDGLEQDFYDAACIYHYGTLVS